MQPEEAIGKIKDKAIEFARTHATKNAKAFYIKGKKDAACTFLAMIREDGLHAIVDVANQVLAIEPENQHALWVIKNFLNLEKTNENVSSHRPV